MLNILNYKILSGNEESITINNEKNDDNIRREKNSPLNRKSSIIQ